MTIKKQKSIQPIQPLGHRVVGCLATYLAPKMAADSKIKPEELDSIARKINTAKFNKQINGIAGSVKDLFGSRLVGDADLSDLPDILGALTGPTSLAPECDEDEDSDEDTDALPVNLKDKDKESKKVKAKEMPEPAADEDEDEDEDSDEDSDSDEDEDSDAGADSDKDAPAAKLMNKLGTLNLPKDTMDEISGLIDEIGKAPKAVPAPASDDDDDDEDDEKETPIGKPAMDAMIKKIENRMAAHYQAAKEVMPVVGDIDVNAKGASTLAIYKMGLDAMNVDLTGISADTKTYRAIFKLQSKNNASNIAKDSKLTNKDKASMESLFPSAPKLG
jgi:hypothetical protein